MHKNRHTATVWRQTTGAPVRNTPTALPAVAPVCYTAGTAKFSSNPAPKAKEKARIKAKAKKRGSLSERARCPTHGVLRSWGDPEWNRLMNELCNTQYAHLRNYKFIGLFYLINTYLLTSSASFLRAFPFFSIFESSFNRHISARSLQNTSNITKMC